jgi:hypothetical protein
MRTGHQNKFNNNNRQQPNRNGHNPNRNRTGQSGGGKGNSLNRAYESNGPGIKLRGTAHHIAERYVTLARDAQSAGDTIAYEGYMQHAEHYLRLIAANNEILKANNPNFRPAPLPGTMPDEFDEDENEEGQNEADHMQADQPEVEGERYQRPHQNNQQHNNQPRRRFDNSGEQPVENGEARSQEPRQQQEARPQGENRRERFNRDRFNRDPQPQNNVQNNGEQPRREPTEPRPQNEGRPQGEGRQQNEGRRERRPYPPQVQQDRAEQPIVENFGLPAFLMAAPAPVKPEAVIIAPVESEAPAPRRRGRPKFEPKDPATVPVD